MQLFRRLSQLFLFFFIINAHYEPLGRITIVGQSARISFSSGGQWRRNQRLEQGKKKDDDVGMGPLQPFNEDIVGGRITMQHDHLTSSSLQNPWPWTLELSTSVAHYPPERMNE